MADSRLKKVGYYRLDASGAPLMPESTDFLVKDENGNIGIRSDVGVTGVGFYVYPSGDVTGLNSSKHIQIYPTTGSPQGWPNFYRITGSGWGINWDREVSTNDGSTKSWKTGPTGYLEGKISGDGNISGHLAYVSSLESGLSFEYSNPLEGKSNTSVGKSY